MKKPAFRPLRVVPDAIKALLPPHPIEFAPNDPNAGRACGRCGFSLPAGTRQEHAGWCNERTRETDVITVRLPREVALEWKQFLIISFMCGNDTDLNRRLAFHLKEALPDPPKDKGGK